MDNNGTYLRELAQFQGSISVLLNNIQELIKQIPDRRDQTNIITDLTNISEQLNNLNINLDSFLNNTNIDHNTHSNKIEILDTLLTNINDKLVNINVDNIKVCHDRIDKLYKCFHLDNSENLDNIYKDIHTAGKLSKELSKEITKLKAILEDDFNTGNYSQIKLEDIRDVIEVSKRVNKRYKFWNSWKGLTAKVTGILLSITLAGIKIYPYILDLLTKK